MAVEKTMVSVKGTEKKGFKFDFYKLLLLFALIPLVVSVVVVTLMTVTESKTEIKEIMHNYMYSMAVSEGQGLADEIDNRGKIFALASNSLEEYCSDISIGGLPSSYCYVADAEGTMLYHPTAEKVGQPVTNETILAVCADMAQGKADAAQVVEYKFKGEMKYAAYYVPDNCNFVLVIAADEKEVMADINKLTLHGFITAAILIVVFAVIALLFSGKLAKAMNKVVQGLEALSAGNLNADMDAQSSLYETTQLIESSKKLQSVLQDTIGQTQTISNELKYGAENVAQLAEHSREGSNQISQAMEDLAQGATSMAENVQSINEQIIEMGSAIDGISSNAEALVELSNVIKGANDDATEYIGKVSSSSEKSVDAVAAISEQIKATNDSVTKIKDAADMIGSIANQTNLLALNASIEAARAGEAGRGFAVVAEEIKNLSEQSNASADEIRQVVNEVIAQSTKSVNLSTQVAEIISDEQNFIEQTEQKFEILHNEINKSLEEINNISGRVENLETVKAAITSSVSDLSAISEENAASNEEVSASVSEIASSIGSIAENSGSTNEMAENLTETVSYFK